MKGFLILPRRIFGDFLWTEARRFSKAEAYIDLLQTAAFKPVRRLVRDKLLDISEGEVCASLRYLATRWGWNKDTVGSFLNQLEKAEEIRRTTRQGESIITLCNYGEYTRQADTAADTTPDAEPDVEQTDSRRTADKYEKGKKGNDMRESACATPADFTENARKIVEAYPRREKILAAMNIVAGHLREGDNFEVILSGTKAAAAVIRTLPSGASNRYVPSAVAFFEGKRWADDPETLRRQGDTKSGSMPMSEDEFVAQLGGRARKLQTTTP